MSVGQQKNMDEVEQLKKDLERQTLLASARQGKIRDLQERFDILQAEHAAAKASAPMADSKCGPEDLLQSAISEKTVALEEQQQKIQERANILHQVLAQWHIFYELMALKSEII